MHDTLNIIYQDNHLIVVNKPGGVLTQPSGTDQESLEKWVKDWIKREYQKPGNVFLQALHRLDKPASGVVLFARTSKALSRLHAAMRNQQTKKRYLAVVEGSLEKTEGILENFLIHEDYRARVAEEKEPDAKLARLQYKIVDKDERFSLLEIELQTGRYHQIRVQLAHLGCPIIGDSKYGSTVVLQEGCIALHHASLEIAHPVTMEMLRFTAELPSYWPW